MDPVYVSALAALAGSIVGGLTSGFTSWINQREQARAGRRAHDISRREELFKDFVIAASRAYGAALVSNDAKIEELVALYAMVSRMRVLCQPRTVASAENVMAQTVETFFAPNRSIREVHEMIHGGAGLDPLKEFAEAARDELRGAIRAR
jgi:hypothetical protein